jgi:hypothetical protein
MTAPGGEIFELMETALLTQLGGHSGLRTLVGANLYSGQAPDKTPPPYVIYTFIHGGFTNSSPRSDVSVFYQVECWSLIQAEVRTGAKHIYNALQDAVLNLGAYWNNYYLNANTWLARPPENVAGKQWWRRGAVFEIRADQRS